VRAGRPAGGDHHPIDRGGYLGAGLALDQLDQLRMGLGKGFIPAFADHQPEVGQRRLPIRPGKPAGRHPRRFAVQALAGGLALPLLVEPPLHVRSGRNVAPDREAMIAGLQAPPDLCPAEESDQVSRDLGAQVPPRLAPHETRITRHAVHAPGCSSRVVNRT
jgi:hypothetical protein